MRVILKEFPKHTKFIRLYPISDVHWGAAECMEKEFKTYLKLIEDDPNGYVILGGDLINNGLKSSVTNVYDEKYPPSDQKKAMVKMLRPIAHKVLAVVTGNHEYRDCKEVGKDVTEDICAELGIEDCYAKDAAFLKVSLGLKANQKQATYMIYISHGSGGGAALGSGLSRQDAYQMSIEGVDISITGHTHKPTKTPSARLIFDPHNNNIIKRNTLIFVCTSWLDYGGYPDRMQLRATAFYPDTIRLDGTRKIWS